MISLLPGPVEIADEIHAAFCLPPVYHRSPEFIQTFEGVRAQLSQMTHAPYVALLNGSGTLANEVIGGSLDGPGIVLVNGEFGSRLANQAKRWNLPVCTIEWPWGTRWNLDEVRAQLGNAEWIWAVHLETSTGMVNDTAGLRDLCRNCGVRLALDCVSSLGAVPVDLRGVSLASAVSGKALGSYAGVAIVFASEIPQPRHQVPAYLDLASALRTIGPCFTFPSPQLRALEAALRRRRDYRPLGDLVRRRLPEIGSEPLVRDHAASPIVTTFAPPMPGFLERCRSLGYHIGGESSYLAARGLVQIATMGAVAMIHVNSLFDSL